MIKVGTKIKFTDNNGKQHGGEVIRIYIDSTNQFIVDAYLEDPIAAGFDNNSPISFGKTSLEMGRITIDK